MIEVRQLYKFTSESFLSKIESKRVNLQKLTVPGAAQPQAHLVQVTPKLLDLELQVIEKERCRRRPRVLRYKAK